MRKRTLEELERISIDEFREARKLPVCVVLDHVRSLHNVGSVFRTADAFRIEELVLTGITGQPPHREIEKTALGATASVAWRYVEDTASALADLRAQGWTIVVVEQTTASQPLHQIPWHTLGRLCLVFGNEVRGVSEAALPLAQYAVEIPQAGTKHSLNISVCAGIVLWEVFRTFELSQRVP